MEKRKAFTLVELLVVIAIIAILMAILIPALTRVKDQANNVVCANNLSSYAMAANMYPDDNDGALPLSFLGAYNAQYGGVCIWHNKDFDLRTHPELQGALWPYLKNPNIMLCNRFKTITLAGAPGHTCPDPTIAMHPIFSYTQNAFMGCPLDLAARMNYSSDEIAACSVKVAEVRSPGQTFFYSEENWFQIIENGVYRCGAPINDTNLRVHPSPDYGDYDMFATFHNTPTAKLDQGGCNMVLVDGHTEFLKLTFDDVQKGAAWRLANTKSKIITP